jgi:hypothetical protein
MNPKSKIQNSPSSDFPTQSTIPNPERRCPHRHQPDTSYTLLATAAPPPIHHPKSIIGRRQIFTFPISQNQPPIEILKSRHARG